MAMIKHPANNKLMISRLTWLQRLIILSLGFFVGRLWYLQIIQGDYYAQLAEQNGIRTISLLAPRGILRDREGRPIVVNRPAFNAYLLRENIRNLSETLTFISKGLNLKKEDILQRLEKFRPAPSFQPILVKEDLSIQDIAFIEAHQREHPELRITSEPRRFYSYGSMAAHTLGYVGEISEDQIKSGEFPDSKMGDIIGKAGIEKQYNVLLRGKDGKKRVVVNSLGKEIDVLSRQEPVMGQELWLTIDLDLQQLAEELLEDKTGSVVALDPNNGEVLALVNRPAFDPNSFAVRISLDEWKSLISDPDHPLQNRAIQSTFSPGSVFKAILAFAGLEENMLSPTTSVTCGGSAFIYGHLFHCHKRHGFVDLNRAIVNSCNVFFYNVGKNLGIEKIAKHAKAVGLGEKTDIDLPDEKSGVFPTPEWKLRTRGEKWYAGETISVAIGQGAMTVTPMQLAKAMGIIATGGKVVRPHVLLRPLKQLKPKQEELKEKEKGEPDSFITTLHAGPNKNGEPIDTQPDQASEMKINMSDRSRQIVVKGMWGVVNEWGTGTAAKVEGHDVCGKTGTAQTISGAGRTKIKAEDKKRFADNAWFVGFAPKDNPEIVVAVLVERGGFGGVASAPIAGAILREYFSKKKKDSPLNLLAASRQ